MAGQCTHLDQIQDVTPKTSDGCEECLETGSGWIGLRMCLTCGHIGCCDSSLGQHATNHFHETGHPVMESYKSRASWRWCYVDELYMKA